MPKTSDDNISAFKNAIRKYPDYVSEYVKYNDICKQLFLEATGLRSPSLENTGATIQHNSNNDRKLLNYISDKEYYARILEGYNKLINWIVDETGELFQTDPIVGVTIWRKYIYCEEYQTIENNWHLSYGTPLSQRFQSAFRKTVQPKDIHTYRSILKEIDKAKRTSRR